MESTYKLIMRAGAEMGKEFPLEKSELVIGRDQGNDIVIVDPEVSRRHARVFQQGGGYVIEDLGSTNGTYVNGQRLTGPYVLRSGELINLGEHISLLYDVSIFDPDATVASSTSGSYAPPTRQPAPAAANVPAPAPAPAKGTPAPAGFSGQVPTPPEEAKPRKRLPTWAIVLIIAIIAIVIFCVLPVVIIDATNQWCNLFKDVFNGISPGVCP
ncbi:MAG TPA: FHA domain-containing protein [Longilinea sp.]|nr:FHA domain-containing protein [Longilinea sp.]